MENRRTEKTVFTILITFLLIGSLIYFQNGYFDLLQAKWNFFITVSVIIIFVHYMYKVHAWDKKCSYSKKLLWIYAFVLIIETIVSDFPVCAFWGTSDWRTGSFFMLMCIVICTIIAEWDIDITEIIKKWFVANAGVLVLGLLNVLDFDPLGMISQLSEEDYGLYISTVGNVNWYGAYLAIVFPLSVFLFVESQTGYEFFLYGTVFLLALVNIVICNSDCAVIGFIVTVIAALIFRKYYVNRGKYGLVLLLISSIALVTLHILDRKRVFVIEMGMLQRLMISPIVILIACIVFIYLYVSAREKTKKIYIVFLIFSFLLVTGIILRFGLLYPLVDTISYYLTFNENWGNGRGEIWAAAIRMFLNFNWKDRLLGTGCDTFSLLIQKYEIGILIDGERVLKNAHCEFLQLLITTGIIGVGLYYYIFGRTVKKCVKTEDGLQRALSVALLSYLVQQLVNNIQAVTTPISFILLGFLLNSFEKEKK